MPDETPFLPTQGTKLYYGELGDEPATLLAFIDDLTEIPGLTSDEYETTPIDRDVDEDVNVVVKEFQEGNADPGQLVMNLGFDPDNIDTVYSLRGVRKSWKIAFLDGSAVPFDGWIKLIKPTPQKGKHMIVGVTIRATSAPKFVPAA